MRDRYKQINQGGRMNNFYLDAPKETGALTPSNQSTRSQLEYQKRNLEERLANVAKALALLEAHPEIGEFMDAMRNA